MTVLDPLAFGLPLFPRTARALWGARLIFPADLLWDRQSLRAATPDAERDLLAWLNPGPHAAISTARARLSQLAETYRLTSADEGLWLLVDDGLGLFYADCRASHGYIYVAAALRAHLPPAFVAPEAAQVALPVPSRRRARQRSARS